MAQHSSGGPADPRALRNALGSFLTGVTIVTTFDKDGRARGFTANSFTSVSLDPPLILVCPAKSAASYDVFKACDGFAVSVLQDSQKAASTLFASKSPEKFASVETLTAVTGAPIIADSLSWFDCTPHQRIDAGDHLVLIGRVEAFDSREGQPLGYLRGKYVDLGLDSEALEAGVEGGAHLGCIVDFRGRVLLLKREDGQWGLPTAPIVGPGSGHRHRIDQILQKLGVKAEVAFLYSVFEVPSRGQHFIIYRGECRDAEQADSLTSEGRQFFDRDTLPWDRLPAPEFRTMLERYFTERSVARFGVYAETHVTGSVARLDDRPEPWRESPQGSGDSSG